ncbi:MAG: SRPBCC domain-containing protein [Steroidobacteraceae bacterium]
MCEIDHRVGGRWRHVLRAPDGSEHAFSGEYREIVAPKRLVYTENYELLGPGHEIVVTATLEERVGHTHLRSHLLYKSQADRDGHLQSGMETGVNESHDRLTQLLGTLI